MEARTTHVKSWLIHGKVYEIYGIYYDDTPNGEYDHYEVDHDGECINLGAVFWSEPTEEDIKKLIEGGNT